LLLTWISNSSTVRLISLLVCDLAVELTLAVLLKQQDYQWDLHQQL
jgi:hypothetical protein